MAERRVGRHRHAPQLDARREGLQEVLWRECPQRIVERDDQDAVRARAGQTFAGDLRGQEARDSGAGPDDLVGVRLEDHRDRARRPLACGPSRGVQQMPVPSVHAVEDAERHDGRPDGRDVQRHSSGVLRNDLLGTELAAAQRPDADQLTRLVEDLDPPVRCVIDGLCRTVHEAPRGVGTQRQGRQREQRTHWPHGLCQATLGGERLEPVGRERVLRKQPRGFRAAQSVEMSAGAQPLAKVARDRPDVGARRAAQVDPDVQPTLARAHLEHVDRVDRDGPRREIDRLPRACRSVRRATRDLPSAERRRPLFEGADESRSAHR